MKLLLSLVMLVIFNCYAIAQINVVGLMPTYTQNFNTLVNTGSSTTNTTLPAGWQIAELGTNGSNTYRVSTGSTATGDTYSFGAASDTDRALGSIASISLQSVFGVKFVNNSGTAISGMNISYRGEQWRTGNSAARPDSLVFQYNTSADSVGHTSPATAWVSDTSLSFYSLANVGAARLLDGNLAANSAIRTAALPISIPVGGTIVLRWVDVDITANDDGLAIDDFSITFINGNYRPNIVSLLPADNTTNLDATTDTLKITFDREVVAGIGSIYLKNEQTGAVVTKAALSPDVRIQGKEVDISGLSLANNTKYHVTFDSLAFDTASFYGYGIYDTTQWDFKTQVAQIILTKLNEDFDTACAINSLPNGWEAVSVLGSQTWTCTPNGANGTAAFEMYGFQGGNIMNEDWLITPKLNTSSTSHDILGFDASKKFAGADLQILYSLDYTGNGMVSSATWRQVNPNPFPFADTLFRRYFFFQLPKGTAPYNIAFKYTSTATDGALWRIDNVETSRFSGITDNKKLYTLPITILGNSTNNQIVLSFTAKNNGAMQLHLTDLTGREVYSQKMMVNAGNQKLTISNLNLAPGMYVLRIGNAEAVGTAKVVVQ